MKPKKSLPKGRRLGSNKRGILIKGKWKAVELDPSLFADQAMGGLVCFEELTDYSLVDSDRALIAAEKLEKNAEEKKKKKRKASELQAEEEEKEEEEEVAEVDGQALEEALVEGDDEEQEELVGDDADVTEQPAKKKRKKQKKKKKKKPADEATATASAKEAGLLETGRANQCGSEENDGKDQETAGESLGQETEGDEKSNNAEKKKKKRNKKKKQQPEVPRQTAATTDAQTPAAPQEDQVSTPASQSKKKKVKNWTSAALGGSSAAQAADVTAWKDLFVPEPVLRALSKLGFSAPTPIQALALPPAIRDHMDILGAAETGSGKTLSFGIPVIHNILEWKSASESWKLSQAAGASDTDATPQEGGAVSLPDSDAAATGEEEKEGESLESSAKEKGPAEASEQTPSVTVTEADAQSKEDGAIEREEGAEEHNLLRESEEEDEGLEEDEDELSAQSNGSNSDSEDDGDDDERGCVPITETAFDKSDVKGSDKQPLLALILAPTRELAVQVKHHIDAIAQFTDIRTALIVGGMAPQKQQRVLNRRPEIVIATPGRLWDLIKEEHPHLQNLRHVRSLVIDEADRMVERGHFAELENLLEMLSTSQFNPKRQTFVFSATLTMVHTLPQRVQQKKGKRFQATSKLDLLMQKVGIKDKPKVIDLTRKEATVETLTETRIHCEKEEKDLYLYYFLSQYPGRTMVFANSIDCIKRLNSLLVILDHTPLPLHANMHQKQRLKNLERFAERDNCVLLTTDVAARGLDIPNVQHVIHYQVPRTSETYVHRSGRTARATKQGLSLLLIGPDDLMNYKKIYRTLGKDEDLPMFPIQTRCMTAIKERVKLAWQIEKVEYHNSKQKQHNSWFRQAAEAMEIDLDDDMLISPGHGKEDDARQQKMVKGMKKQLKHLLSQPIFRSDMKTKYPTQMGKLQLPELPLASVETALTSVTRHKDKMQWRHKKPKKN